MPKVEDVKVLNIDGVPHAVDSMSDQVKQLVEIYNDWNRDAAEAQSRLMQLQAAKNDLSRQIIMQVRQEKAAEAEAEASAANKDGAPEANDDSSGLSVSAAVNTTEVPEPDAEDPVE